MQAEFRTGVIKPVEVYKEAWELIKDQYWLFFGITVVGLIIGSAVPIVLIGPMICGIYMCLLKRVDGGGEIRFEMLFKGFDYFLPSLLVAVVTMVPVFILIFAIYIPFIAMAIAGPRMSEDELIPLVIATILFEFVVAFIMVCFHTLLMFAFPLVADRKMSGMQAMKLSMRAVWQNLSGVAGLFGVGMLVCIVGYLALCIGIYLAMPLIFMANAIAFRKVFPPLAPMSFEPPPPSNYRGI